MRDSNLIADASCHFTDDLYPLKQRALQQFADIEAGRSSWTWRLLLSIAANVRQTLTVVSNRVTALHRNLLHPFNSQAVDRRYLPGNTSASFAPLGCPDLSRIQRHAAALD
jgi:hypothetical protein